MSTPQPLTIEAVRAIASRAAAATPGPWYAVHTDDCHHMCASYVGTAPDGGDFDVPGYERHDEVVAVTLLQQPRIADVGDARWDENAAFIAAARADIPALCATVEALLPVVDAARATHCQWLAWNHAVDTEPYDTSEWVSGEFNNLEEHMLLLKQALAALESQP